MTELVSSGILMVRVENPHQFSYLREMVVDMERLNVNYINVCSKCGGLKTECWCEDQSVADKWGNWTEELMKAYASRGLRLQVS